MFLLQCFSQTKEKFLMKKMIMSFVVLLCLFVLASCGSSPSAPTAGVPTRQPTTLRAPSTFSTVVATTPAQAELPPALTPNVVLGPQACPVAVAALAYWEPIISPYAYGGSHQVKLVSCASMMGNPSLQALVTVR